MCYSNKEEYECLSIHDKRTHIVIIHVIHSIRRLCLRYRLRHWDMRAVRASWVTNFIGKTTIYRPSRSCTVSDLAASTTLSLSLSLLF